MIHDGESFQLQRPIPHPFFSVSHSTSSTSWFVVTPQKGYFSGDSHCLGIWLHGGNYDCYFQSQLNGIGVCYFTSADSTRTTALDDSNGSDLRYKHSAGTSTKKCILFCEKTTISHSLQMSAYWCLTLKAHATWSKTCTYFLNKRKALSQILWFSD